MNKNKKLNKAILILCGIELILIIFFLAYLLVYSGLVGGDSLIMSPALYLVVIFIVFIPIGMLFYYIGIRNRKINVFRFEVDEQKFTNKSKKLVKNEKGKRFSELLKLDIANVEKKEEVKFNEVTSLSEFCTKFRNFCASRKKLYYTEDDIRSFIASLLTSKMMILQGMSGTGKTSIALAFEQFIGNPTTVIAVQPVWKERSDLIGYFNEFTKKFNETPLLKELYRSNFDDQIYIIVLDEMNIARIEYYFAEFLSLLEYPNEDQRTLEITNDSWPKDPKMIVEGRLKIKRNVYFLGTANNDESTFSISDKVYDRSMILNLDNKAKSFEAPDQGEIKISNENFENLAKAALNSFDGADRLKQRINVLNKILIQHFAITFGNRMVNQMMSYVPIYVACGGNEEDAFDDFVAKKILRKLDGKDIFKVASSLPSFLDALNQAFGINKMLRCKKYLKRFEVR